MSNPTGPESERSRERVESIIKRAKGDVEKEKQYARVMANTIDTFKKAFFRAEYSKIMKKEHMQMIFLERAKKLSYSASEIKIITLAIKKIKLKQLMDL